MTLDMPAEVLEEVEFSKTSLEFVKIRDDYSTWVRVFGDTGNHQKAMEKLIVGNFKKVRK